MGAVGPKSHSEPENDRLATRKVVSESPLLKGKKEKQLKKETKMKKYELREKMKVLKEVSECVFRAGNKQGRDALEYNLDEETEKVITEELVKASDKIENAIKLLEDVFDTINYLTK